MNGNALRDFIQDTMLIDDPVTGAYVPFRFRKAQNLYYDTLVNEFGSQWWFEDIDELNLKARKMGFTSMWLGCFAAIMQLYPEPRRFLEISYKSDGTKQHFRRMRTFLLSPLFPDPKTWTDKLYTLVFDVHTEGSEIVLKENKASFYCGTATSRTGERGGTVQAVLFTEAAHYPDTTIITADEIIEGTRSMISVGTGIKVIETTANGFNHFRRRWKQAVDGLISAKPRFFGWKLFYSQEEFEKVKMGYSEKTLIAQEYPENAEEAFLTSGRPVFKISKLKEMEALVADLSWQGCLEDDKAEIRPVADDKGPLKIWKRPRRDRKYMITADIAGGISDVEGLDPKKAENRCWSVACVFDRHSWEVVAELRIRCDPGEFGRMMVTLGEFYNFAILIPEANNHGAGTLEAIKNENYSHLFRTDEIWVEGKKAFGFPHDERTKSLTLTALRNAIDEMSYKENSTVAIDEMYQAVFDNNSKMTSAEWLDCTITRMIGLYCLKFYALDDTYRRKDKMDSPILVTSHVGKSEGTIERFRKRRI